MDKIVTIENLKKLVNAFQQSSIGEYITVSDFSEGPQKIFSGLVTDEQRNSIKKHQYTRS